MSHPTNDQLIDLQRDMNERAEEKMKYDQLPLNEKVILGLKIVHDDFSGHVGVEEEHKDCEHCYAIIKSKL